MSDLEKEVREILAAQKSPEAAEQELLIKGHLKEEIDKAIHAATGHMLSESKHRRKSTADKFFIKEIFDRIGYGFGSEQYINILFLQAGAPYYIIAIINGIKAILGSLLSTSIKGFAINKGASGRLLSNSGILFGLSFVLMAIATWYTSVPLFIIASLLGVIGMVAYGELYQHTIRTVLKDEKRGQIEGIYKYGLIITIISLLLAAYIMDRYALLSFGLNIFGRYFSMSLFGYFLVFELAALFFILAGVQLLSLERPKNNSRFIDILRHIPYVESALRQDMAVLLKKKRVVLLIIASSLTGMVQILGSSFYGIFVYDHFRTQGFGGFLNVAMISILALLVSLITPVITRENSKAYGKYPMLIFGTCLMAIMPMAFYLNPNLMSIGLGTILGVTGAAILGIAHGLLSADLIPKDIAGDYFSAFTVLTIVPYFITVPLGAYVVQVMGITKMLLYLSLVLICLVLPIYFLMMLYPAKAVREAPAGETDSFIYSSRLRHEGK